MGLNDVRGIEATLDSVLYLSMGNVVCRCTAGDTKATVCCKPVHIFATETDSLPAGSAAPHRVRDTWSSQLRTEKSMNSFAALENLGNETTTKVSVNVWRELGGVTMSVLPVNTFHVNACS